MFSKSIYFLVLCSALVILRTETIAQSQTELDKELAGLTTTLTRAIETSVFENGRLQSLRIRLPNNEERLIKFEYPAKDEKSYTMIDNGLRIQVVLDDNRKISSIVFPNGRSAFYDWVLAPNGYWLPKAIKVDGRDLCSSNRSNVIEEEGCYEVCQQAAAATAIAIGQCIASGGTSAACYGATATAAYLTYKCYRCTNPQMEWPPEN